MLAAAAFCMLAAAQAGPSASDGYVVAAPLKWKLADSRFYLDGFYPERAVRQGVSGHATLICTAADAQTLKSCKVQEEDPKGQNFSDAARAICGRLLIDSAEMEAAGDSVLLTASFKNGKISVDLRRLTPSPRPDAKLAE